MSDTSPSDRARIELLAGGDPYRLLMLEKMFEVAAEASENKAWRLAHDKADDARFAAVASELVQIKAKAGSVSSSVGGLEIDRAKVIGVKDAAKVLFRFLAALIAAGWAVWMTFFRDTP